MMQRAITQDPLFQVTFKRAKLLYFQREVTTGYSNLRTRWNSRSHLLMSNILCSFSFNFHFNCFEKQLLFDTFLLLLRFN